MSSRRASQSSRVRSQSSRYRSAKSGSIRSSAYNNTFDQHLGDYNIHPVGYRHPDGYLIKPSNLDEVRRGLSAPRESPSLSQFGESDFQDFEQPNEQVVFEADVMRTV